MESMTTTMVGLEEATLGAKFDDHRNIISSVTISRHAITFITCNTRLQRNKDK
jgi:hypothetical protein